MLKRDKNCIKTQDEMSRIMKINLFLESLQLSLLTLCCHSRLMPFNILHAQALECFSTRICIRDQVGYTARDNNVQRGTVIVNQRYSAPSHPLTFLFFQDMWMTAARGGRGNGGRGHTLVQSRVCSRERTMNEQANQWLVF